MRRHCAMHGSSLSPSRRAWRSRCRARHPRSSPRAPSTARSRRPPAPCPGSRRRRPGDRGAARRAAGRRVPRRRQHGHRRHGEQPHPPRPDGRRHRDGRRLVGRRAVRATAGRRSTRSSTRRRASPPRAAAPTSSPTRATAASAACRAPGLITTVAGTVPGFSGDGGPAAVAQLNAPSDTALTADGGYAHRGHRQRPHPARRAERRSSRRSRPASARRATSRSPPTGRSSSPRRGAHRLLRIAPDGAVTVVAGVGPGLAGDGDPAATRG